MTIDQDSFYASCVVNLTIRYDEALQVNTAVGETKKSQASKRTTPNVTIGQAYATDTPAGDSANVAPKKRPRPGLTSTVQLGSVVVTDSSGTRTVKVGDNGGQAVVPLSFGSDGYTVIGSRVPLKGSFKLPHPREAGQFSLVFDYADLPIDPRLVRALGVEIHLGTVSAENYARGMGGQTDSSGRPLSIIKTRTDQLDPKTHRAGVDLDTLLFFAVADEWDVDHDIDGGSIVTIEGRDIRGILIDAKIPPAKVAKIDLTQPIDKVVVNIIKTMGIDHDLTFDVVTDKNEWENGVVPSPGDADGLTRVRMGSSGEKPTSAPANGGGAGKSSYWDIITNYCELVGAMPQFRGNTLWIRPNKSIFAITSDTKLPTPFAGGAPRAAGNEQLRVRRMVYGRDLKKLHFSRKFAGKVVPTIRCISFDDRMAGKQRLIFGQWPPVDSLIAQAKSDSEILPVPMYGIRSPARLVEIAKGIYEELGRGETGGTAEARTLASYGGDNADPDLLRLRPMDPVEFVIDKRVLSSRSPLVSELANSERRTFAEEVAILTKKLGDADIAQALVALSRGAIRELLQYYQAVGVQYDWLGAKGGCHVAFTFQNYIVPRRSSTAYARVPTAAPETTRADVTGQNKQSKIQGKSAPGISETLARSAVGDVLHIGNLLRRPR